LIYMHSAPAAQDRRDTGSRHIALLFGQSDEYTRGLLRGFQSYISRKGAWSLFLGDPDWIMGGSLTLEAKRFDGVITIVKTRELAHALQAAGLPAVDMSSEGMLPELPCVYTDDESVARLAADHLLERGYRSLGYCGDTDCEESASRGSAFARYAQVHNVPCALMTTNRLELAESWMDRGNRLVDWISNLPKPAGIFVSDDALGQKVLETCLLMELPVPDEVGVIGVGNDSLLCSLSSTPLSSIAQDTTAAGYRAAELLDRMMEGEFIESKSHPIEPLGVVARLSTDASSVSDSIVAEVIRFIRSNVDRDINVESILQHFEISRRALEQRFRKAIGQTPHDEIIAAKLKLVKQLLMDTALTLPMIAERAGYKHSEYMSTVFKKRVGISPGEFRKRLIP
jgi:LacI family transcriptional regulator